MSQNFYYKDQDPNFALMGLYVQYGTGGSFAGDVLASTVVLAAMLVAGKPADPEHPYVASTLEKDLTRLYYLGQFDEYVKRIADVPGR